MKNTKSVSDEGFFREISGEVKKEKLNRLWVRFRLPLIGLVIFSALIGSGIAVYDYSQKQKILHAGEKLSEALDPEIQRNEEQVLQKLKELEQEKMGIYKVLAQMKISSIFVSRGEVKEAISLLRKIEQDSQTDRAIRDLARLRIAFLLVDTGSGANVKQEIETLFGKNSHTVPLAQEALGLSAWKEGQMKDAYHIFSDMMKNQSTTPHIRERVAVMIELICRSGKIPCDPV